MAFPARRFFTLPRPPGVLAARRFAAVMRPPRLFFAIALTPFPLFVVRARRDGADLSVMSVGCFPNVRRGVQGLRHEGKELGLLGVHLAFQARDQAEQQRPRLGDPSGVFVRKRLSECVLIGFCRSGSTAPCR